MLQFHLLWITSLTYSNENLASYEKQPEINLSRKQQQQQQLSRYPSQLHYTVAVCVC